MKLPSSFLPASATALALLALSATTNAATINSFATGDWEIGGTWDSGTAPALVTDDAFILNGHTVTMDRDQTANTADDTTLGPVQVNAGGQINSWYGNMNTGAFTFNGGTVISNQRTLQLKAPTIAVTSNGGLWGTRKQQNKTAWLISPTLTGTGDLTSSAGKVGNNPREIRIPDMTGFTGNHVTSGDSLLANAGNTATELTAIKFTNSVTEANATFGIVLNSSTYDWKETSGGTPALDDGTYYDGYDISNANIELWVTDLTIGGFTVPGRSGTAYTYAELAAMNGGDVGNYLKTDGTDGFIGVLLIPEPSTMALLSLAGLAMLRRRRS